MKKIGTNATVIKVGAMMVLATFCALILLDQPIPEEISWLIFYGFGYITGEDTPPGWLKKGDGNEGGNDVPF